MNKADLVDRVSENVGLSKRDTRIVVTSVIDNIVDGLLDDGKVTLVGFGTFSTGERKARKARNPRTGESIDVPAKTVAKFKPSQQLKGAINES